MKGHAKHNVRDLVPRFYAYYAKNPAWGSLHVVMDDGNWDSVWFCEEYAEKKGDYEGAELARILQELSPTQRGRLARLVHDQWWDNHRAAIYHPR